jgi:hypothetical protein
MKERDNIGKGFLTEKLGGYQVDPPESVWVAISARLGGRNRRGLLFFTLAAAASFALAVTLGIHYFAPSIPDEVGMASEDRETIQQGPSPVTQPVEVTPETAREPSRKHQRMSLEQKVKQTIEPAAVEKSSYTGLEVARIAAADQVEQEEQEEVVQPKTAVATPDEEIQEEQTKIPEVEDSVDSSSETAVLDAVEVQSEVPAIEFEQALPKDHRWTIGAALSPLYSFRDAAPSALDGNPDQESGFISYAGGLQVGYRTTRRLTLETGVFMNRMGISIGAPGIQVTSNENEYDFTPVETEMERSNVMAVSNSVGNIVSWSGDIYVNNYKLNADAQANTGIDQFNSEVYAEQGIRQHLDYLEVPFNLRYTLVDRSFKLQLVGGLSTNLLVNNYVTMESPDGPTEIGYLTNIRSVNYSGNAGLGFIYYFLDRLSLSLEPRFRYFLNSVNDETLPSTRPYTFGLYTGLNYFF